MKYYWQEYFMSVKQVADMLALAYEGYDLAKKSNDLQLKHLSHKLVVKALSSESAAEFFGGIQLALAEVHENPFGNDPDIDDNDNGILDPEDDEIDENSPAASPAYEGITDNEDSSEDEKNKPEESSLIDLVAQNFLRLRK
jgi:hypothetical protein